MLFRICNPELHYPNLSVAFSYGLQNLMKGFQPGGQLQCLVKTNNFRGTTPAFHPGILSLKRRFKNQRFLFWCQTAAIQMESSAV